MRILVSTSNQDKVREIKSKLGHRIDLVTKDQAGFKDLDVEETGLTLEENAFLKAKALYDLVKEPVFADDTGLYVDSLDGQPGIYSARYAGEGCSYEDNVKKLLKDMKDFEDPEDRKAFFETVICFIDENGRENYIHGRMDGTIAKEKRGDQGFGYDPIFIPQGFDKSFAELGLDIKNKISHRAKAIDKFSDFLRDLK
ncbi:MAG: RdgB/HAM1 family non-canonical purine NTP pyrophosphatase [Tissierellia bacterium]|nr:RdgB/HAM1 family non-canonical purine NTP pyrophosphatase [Tissierellia bacterium]